MGIRLSPNNPKNNSWRDDYPMTYLTSFSDDRTKARKEQMTDISSMTDEQLNEALAIEVMGWGLDLIENEWGLRYYRGADGKSVMDARLWQPCTDLNQAVECAEKVWAWKLGVNTSYVPSIHATAYTKAGDTWFSESDTPARALCETVLMAVRGEGKG